MRPFLRDNRNSPIAVQRAKHDQSSLTGTAFPQRCRFRPSLFVDFPPGARRTGETESPATCLAKRNGNGASVVDQARNRPSAEAWTIRRLDRLRDSRRQEDLLRLVDTQGTPAEEPQSRSRLSFRLIPARREGSRRDRCRDGFRREGEFAGRSAPRLKQIRACRQGHEPFRPQRGRGRHDACRDEARWQPRGEGLVEAGQRDDRPLLARGHRSGARSGGEGVQVSPLAQVAPAGPPLTSLAGGGRAELAARLRELGVPAREQRMRVGQLWHWMYHRGATEFGAMTTIGKEMRAELARSFSLERPRIVSEHISSDGTRKWLLRMPPKGLRDTGVEIETVYIPEVDRGTLCVSSQVGCTLTCSFCHTGTQRLVRNLDASEIVGQLLVARDQLGDWPGTGRGGDGAALADAPRLISNIVFMGMGEPLYNFDAVKEAVETIADGEGLSLSRRRITLSTSGVVPMIARAGAEIGTMLAVSLHAVRDELRDELVPLNKKYPISTLLEACRAYPGLSNARRITFEYVMLKGVNDTDADARELVRLLRGVPAKINLIPFNPWPGTRYECSSWNRIESFSEIVFNAGYASPIRTPRGRDILAACGQLKSETEKLRARARLMLESGIGAEGMFASSE
ncbi:MAG: 23S rRNA (adenine(2503)-C(2))-methyltransferase RlmN [Hyphomicrobiales bacterium]|nr:23S rRNA (adenine(2503)-C(2))-methyltransferase RlmN [Hyphomicrobiales bacterium]